MVKREFFLIILILLIIGIQSNAVFALSESEVDKVNVEDTMDHLDLSFLEEYKDNIEGEIGSYLDRNSAKEWIIAFVKGEWQFDVKEILENLLSFFLKEVFANASLLGKLIILSVVSALLINLQSAFSSGIARIAYLACFLAISAIAIASFQVVLNIANTTIDNMVAFMIGMLPPILILVAGLGNINASLLLYPILMTTASFFANCIKLFVFPLIIMSAILSIINQLSDTIKVEKLGNFFKQISQVSLGLFLTIFVGIITMRAVYASVLDRVTLRTTKFFTDNAVPVVGKMFSETIEVAAGYVILLKQALSIYGAIIVLGIIIFPLIKIATIALIYKAVAAIIEPIGDAKTAAMLDSMSAHLMLILAAVASVGLMFFFMIAILAGMTNQFWMMR